MGDPKFPRRQFSKPNHPWKGERIKREDEYVRKFGLKNKKEFWKAESLLRHQRQQARRYLPLVLRKDPQAMREAEQLLTKLNRLGILEEGASLDDVLALSVDSILTRRLQTLAFLKGLAATPDQARQLIVHGHVAVGGRRVDVPGYLVPRGQETAIEYAPTSPYLNEAHPLHNTRLVDTTTAAEVDAAAEAEAERHRALKMAEEAEAEDKVDVLDATPDEEGKPTPVEEPEESAEAPAKEAAPPAEEAAAEAPAEEPDAAADENKEGDA